VTRAAKFLLSRNAIANGGLTPRRAMAKRYTDINSPRGETVHYLGLLSNGHDTIAGLVLGRDHVKAAGRLPKNGRTCFFLELTTTSGIPLGLGMSFSPKVMRAVRCQYSKSGKQRLATRLVAKPLLQFDINLEDRYGRMVRGLAINIVQAIIDDERKA
jgi:hypothetical protein